MSDFIDDIYTEEVVKLQAKIINEECKKVDQYKDLLEEEQNIKENIKRGLEEIIKNLSTHDYSRTQILNMIKTVIQKYFTK